VRARRHEVLEIWARHRGSLLPFPLARIGCEAGWASELLWTHWPKIHASTGISVRMKVKENSKGTSCVSSLEKVKDVTVWPFLHLHLIGFYCLSSSGMFNMVSQLTSYTENTNDLWCDFCGHRMRKVVKFTSDSCCRWWRQLYGTKESCYTSGNNRRSKIECCW
jgi:hypothetical protein